MRSAEIRTKFLEFFRAKGHEVIPSDSLVPGSDPTLLFTSAGMNQFKEQFLGHNVTYKRACSSQKCLRTGDLDKVGKSPSHHTFFEMLGNFSFGDYFKKEAIEWAWEFMTEVLGLKKEKLWVSVYEEDRESYGIWRDQVKVPKDKIKKLGVKENFWPSNAPKEGPNGPCGPCSEIFYDHGDGNSVEVWNLVFTEFDRKDAGKLEPLAAKNIDTGMGLERIASVMQGAKTNFETDIFKPIIDEIKVYRPQLKAGDLKRIADHIRAVTFAIADNVPPSNEERGYVIRKLIRRAYLAGGGREPFLYCVVPKVVGVMKDGYPELIQKREEAALIVKEEEEKFENTLSVVMPILEKNLKAAKKGALSGDKIFKLADTHGLPLEIIEEKAKKRKIKLDMAGYNKLMEEGKALSRKGSKVEDNIFSLDVFRKHAPSVGFSGNMPLETKIAFMTKVAKSGREAKAEKANKGDKVRLITDPQSSACYAEAGGQVGDKGTIKGENGAVRISNTLKDGNKIFHTGEIAEGVIRQGDAVILTINSDIKQKIAKNHTATHLLHSALRKVLGGHVHQAGSRVAPDRLRFDFTHMKKLTERELEEIEGAVNGEIGRGTPVKKEEKSLDEAKKEGAIALFGEKYSGKVNVISAGDFSKEVCGGTHVDNTKEIGTFKITRESSVASGVRRIEAITGARAREWIGEKEIEKTKSEKLGREKEDEKRAGLEQLKNAEKELEGMIKKAKAKNGTKVIIEELPGANMAILRKLADKIKSREGNFFIMLAGKEKGKASIVLAFSKNLVSAGADASAEIKAMAKIIQGAGGGRPDFAQAGGKDITKLKKVFEAAEKSAGRIIKGASK